MVKTKLKTLVIGSGGREAALCWHLKASDIDVECAPGSDGISEICPTWSFSDFDELKAKIHKHTITEVIVGPEKYLAEGVADVLSTENISVFGPTQSTARLETDKAFAKDFLERHKIPTARSEVVSNTGEIKIALAKFRAPYVVKASGLAAGKGVWIGSSVSDADRFASDALQFHSSVVIEEFLPGEELSYFVMIDGERALSLGAAQDHKRLLENDLGPNTGGMGAYSPVPLLTESLREKIETKIIEPCLRGFKRDSISYRGFLFVGIMVVDQEPYVLEFNCRMGDPETQALMLRLKTPLTDLISSLKSAQPLNPEFHSGVSLGVVVAASGYPDNPKQNFPLPDLEKPPVGIFLFHSGTRRIGDRWIAQGGRLFCIGSRQPTLLDCQNLIYPWLESKIRNENLIFRKDIGVKAYRHLVQSGS